MGKTPGILNNKTIYPLILALSLATLNPEPHRKRIIILTEQKYLRGKLLQTHPLKADFILILVTLLAAASWIFSKEALMGITPLLFVGIRFLTAGLLLGILAAPELHKFQKRDLLRTALVGVVFGCAVISWILALLHSNNLGVGAFLTSLGIVLAPLVARVFGEPVPPSTWHSLPLAVLGLGFLTLNNGFSVNSGDMAFLWAALFFAIHFYLNSRAASRTPAIALTSVQLMMVGIIALPLSLIYEGWHISIPQAIWGWIIASIIFATGLRFLLQTWAQGMAPVSHVALIMILEPIWVAILAAWWFHEQMSIMQIIGCTLIFTALLLSRWRQLNPRISLAKA